MRKNEGCSLGCARLSGGRMKPQEATATCGGNTTHSNITTIITRCCKQLLSQLQED